MAVSQMEDGDMNDTVTEIDEHGNVQKCSTCGSTEILHDCIAVLKGRLDKVQELAHEQERFQCFPLWERLRYIIGVPQKSKARDICADCGMPQPDEGSLHMEECPGHNPDYCVVCKEEDDGL